MFLTIQNGKTCNSNQWWNNDKCRCECKKHHICEKDVIVKMENI